MDPYRQIPCRGQCGKSLHEPGMCADCLEGAWFLNRNARRLCDLALQELLVSLGVIQENADLIPLELLLATKEATEHFRKTREDYLSKKELETIFTYLEPTGHCNPDGGHTDLDLLCDKLQRMIARGFPIA